MCISVHLASDSRTAVPPHSRCTSLESNSYENHSEEQLECAPHLLMEMGVQVSPSSKIGARENEIFLSEAPFFNEVQ